MTRIGRHCLPLIPILCCVDSYVGAGAVEFIICHAEIQIAFVEEKKITEVGRAACSVAFLTSPKFNSIHLLTFN
jgi:hypothetical protein